MMSAMLCDIEWQTQYKCMYYKYLHNRIHEKSGMAEFYFAIDKPLQVPYNLPPQLILPAHHILLLDMIVVPEPYPPQLP